MGHKHVCVECRVVKNLGSGYSNFHEANCSNCGRAMRFITHRFRPPKKKDNKGWHLVKYLIENGFAFQHVYQIGKSEYYKTPTNNYIPYPHTLKEAKEFVEKYKM